MPIKRGTYDWNGSGFKGDVPGSNKDIGISTSLQSRSMNAVLVFEAPIDLMSYLHPAPESNLQRGGAVWTVRRRRCDTYLRDNPQHHARIILCLDTR